MDLKLECNLDLMESSKEELIAIIRALQLENKELRAFQLQSDNIAPVTDQKEEFSTPIVHAKSGGALPPTTQEKALLDLGSLGSNSIYFLRAADNSLGVDGESATSSAQVRQNYLQLERGANAFKAPDVMFYKSLFSKNHFFIDYDSDSPAFRSKLEDMDSNVDDLRSYLQKLVDKCRSYCEKGNNYSVSGKKFCSLLLKLQDDDWVLRLGDVAPLLSNFGFVLDEIQSYRDGVLSSLETTFAAPMEEFVTREVKTIKKLKMDLQRSGEEYEQALSKYLAMKASADPDQRRARETELAMLRKKFELHRFDIVAELNACASKKKFQLCERVCSALYAYLGYFHQCHTLLATIEPAVRQLTSELNSARRDFSREQLLIGARRTQLRVDLERSQKGTSTGSKIKKFQSKIRRYWGNKREKRRSGTAGSSGPPDLLLSKTNGKVSFSDSYDLDGVDRLSLGGDNDADQPGDRHDEHSKGGYLWKRSTSLNRNWQRRWFFIKEGKMYYVHAEGKEKGSQLICDLLISTVKLDVEPNLMYTFEIISPGQRRYVLQAESEEERDEWVRSLRSEIELSLISSTPAASATTAAGSSSALRQSVFGSGIGTERISLIKAKNSYCADCGAENPEWVSLNLNILICIECSGIHRSLGTHISKVRSLTLDALYDHNIDLLDSLGNEIGRLIWEARLTEEEENNVGITSCLCENAGDRDGDFVVTTSSEQHNKTISTAEKPNPSSSSELKKSFIKSKYVTRKFVKSMSAAASVSLLYSAATTGDLTGMLVAIAAGADINYHHPDNGLMTALHACCINGHVLSVELLCLFNASVDEKDSQDKTPLDYVDNDEGDSALIMDILIQKLERDLQ